MGDKVKSRVNRQKKRKTSIKSQSRKKKNPMGKISYSVLIPVILLVLIGVIMVFSASSYYALYELKDSLVFIRKLAVWAPLGIFIMIIMMSIDYHKLKAFTWPLYIITLILLILVLFSEPINGAYRWLDIGGLSLQPSELGKYSMVAVLALLIDVRKGAMKSFWKGPFLYFVLAGLLAGLVLKGKNLSITAVIMITAFIMVYEGGMLKKHILTIIPAGLAAGVAFIVFEPYRKARLLNFIDPWKDAAGNGYQLIQSFYALGAGGITGLGLGQSRQKTLYMPEPHNDFIFSIIGEELGLIGCIIIICIFIFLILASLSVAAKAKDNYGRLLATGITSIIAVQAIINIAVVTGSMPVTGVPLPFISYGGTSLVINLAAMGVLLNISRQPKLKKEASKEKNSANSIVTESNNYLR